MKAKRKLDLVNKMELFDDTPDLIEKLDKQHWPDAARHVHQMHVLMKHMAAEIKKLRKDLRRYEDDGK